jgi:hypothetical protein
VRNSARLDATRAKGGLGDGGGRGAEVEGGLDGPAAGSLLLRRVADDVDERAVGLGVGVGVDFGGDLDEVGAQAAGVPFAEDRCDLGRGVVGHVPEQVVVRGRLFGRMQGPFMNSWWLLLIRRSSRDSSRAHRGPR